MCISLVYCTVLNRKLANKRTKKINKLKFQKIPVICNGSQYSKQPTYVFIENLQICINNTLLPKQLFSNCGHCISMKTFTDRDFSRRYVRMLAPIMWSVLLKPIWMYLPNRLLLSFRVVFAFPMA